MPAAEHRIPPSLIELQCRAALRIMNLGPVPRASASGYAPHPALAGEWKVALARCPASPAAPEAASMCHAEIWRIQVTLMFAVRWLL